MNLKTGARIGDYEVVRVLGAGGMGCVYQVRNVITGRNEAMKVLLPELVNEPEAAQRFSREIQVLAGLQHPNIAALYTAQRFDNQLVMLMEFVEGTSLSHKLKRGELSVEEGLGCMAQTLSALGYAHARGVVHRDVKPANLMITPEGKVKVMDFGLAKVAKDRTLTRTGTTLGSVFYMSPEQVRGVEEIDGRSDLYSVGVMLYEIVTGRLPFQADSDYSVMDAHVSAEPVPPIRIVPELPAELSRIVLVAISKEPSRRFQTAEEFLANLQPVFSQTGISKLRDVFGEHSAIRPGAPQSFPAAELGGLRPLRWPNYRSMYMLLGSLLAIVALVIVASVIPRFSRTKARNLDAPSVHDEPAPSRSVQPSQTSNDYASAPSRTAQRESQHGAPGATTDNSKRESLRQLRQRMISLDARASTAASDWNSMREEQRKEGLDLRQEILQSLNRMNSYREDANESLRSGDADAAGRYMDELDREITYLEKQAGRR
jgi:eukaryotic-like serine/threonine-protein kinase